MYQKREYLIYTTILLTKDKGSLLEESMIYYME
jgi:hypothetical protein